MHFDKENAMARNNVHLVIIDPQNDFMDIPGATLSVPGANADMQRLANLIDRIGRKLADIHVTLDSHRVIDVGHPGFWRNGDGNSPVPFTMISADDIANRIWFPRNPNPKIYKRMLDYAQKLATSGKYLLMVWPEHCLIGTPGHNVQKDLMQSLINWERIKLANIDYVVKGTNPYTEHYGALMAEVADPEEPSTSLNIDFLEILKKSDTIVVAGEASSHCVKSTIEQIAENIGSEHVKKFVLLTDCMSPVSAVLDTNGNVLVDFPAIASQFMKDMEALGMQLSTSDKFLA